MELEITGPAGNLRGNIQVPGDKSISHRALLFAAMADGQSRLRGRLRAGVIEAMVDCLQALGVEVEELGPQVTLVHGKPWRTPDRPLDCANSGTTMRLLMGALAGSQVSATLEGSRQLSHRPMGRVAIPLRRMGGQIAGRNGADQPPLKIVGSQLDGIDYQLPVASAQVKTALLLAGLHASGPTRLREPSVSRDHSERLLRQLGTSIQGANGALRLEPLKSRLPPFELDIPGDWSAAAFPLAAALLVPESELVIASVGLNPTRTGLLDVLREMGARIEVSVENAAAAEPAGTVRVAHSELRGATIDGRRLVTMIDEFPILAVIATQAQGETRVEGAAELRHKESDRLAVMATELRKLGAAVEERPDGISFQGPTPLTGERVNSHGDHRVAMALAVAGALASGRTVVAGAEAIDESYPGFAEMLVSIGIEIDE